MNRKHKNETHGATTNGQRSRLYRIFRGMWNRCINPNDKDYPHYGGRGISICAEWLDSFAAFRDWANANGYDDSLSIDRIDNDAGYEPGNCRWANTHVQHRNRRCNKDIEIDGVTKTVKEWAELSEVTPMSIYRRLKRGITGKDLIGPSKQFAKNR